MSQRINTPMIDALHRTSAKKLARKPTTVACPLFFALLYMAIPVTDNAYGRTNATIFGSGRFECTTSEKPYTNHAAEMETTRASAPT